MDPASKLTEITTTMITFGMGASTQALFARVGGGIYTKAADVGADWSAKSKQAFLKMTRVTPPQSLITSAITSAMLPVWEPTCSKAMLVRFLPLPLSAPLYQARPLPRSVWIR